MHKILTKSAVVAAVSLPALAWAALDDQGMQYVTAAEGLHGSLRVDILHDTDDAGNDNAGLTGGREVSLRLWVIGSADLGGGLASTYYWEVRSNENAAGDAVATEAWELGLSSAFGDIRFGKLEMVAPRLVPSASLAYERGSNRESFADDPADNGLRWESPVFRGVKVGISATVGDENAGAAGTDDATVDGWSFAGRYHSPLGFSVGASYETQGLPHDAPATGGRDGRSGWRLGARYGRGNWLIGYEHRSYKAFDPYGNAATVGAGYVFGGSFLNAGALRQGLVNSGQVEYSVHALGVRVQAGRLAASANISTEMQIYLRRPLIVPLDRRTLALDVAYALASRSTMVLGWRLTDTEKYPACNFNLAPLNTTECTVDGPNRQNGLNGSVTQGNQVSEAYLFYRVDF